MVHTDFRPNGEGSPALAGCRRPGISVSTSGPPALSRRPGVSVSGSRRARTRVRRPFARSLRSETLRPVDNPEGRPEARALGWRGRQAAVDDLEDVAVGNAMVRRFLGVDKNGFPTVNRENGRHRHIHTGCGAVDRVGLTDGRAENARPDRVRIVPGELSPRRCPSRPESWKGPQVRTGRTNSRRVVVRPNVRSPGDFIRKILIRRKW